MDASVYETAPGRGPDAPIGLDRGAELLSRGRLILLGQIVSSSNIIFLNRVEDDSHQALAIYKPRRGEVPLWDFPQGTLCLREVAAYALSRALGWPLIPPCVLRSGQYGPGALQLYIDANPADHYFTLRQERQADLVSIAIFDLLTNNADRKGGHLLLDRGGQIWAIDNALTFHAEPKLRTVIWDYAGEPISHKHLADLRELHDQLSPGSDFLGLMTRFLAEDEIAALQGRLVDLLQSARMPQPDPTRRQFPWPPI